MDDGSVIRASFLSLIGATQIVNTFHYVLHHDSGYPGSTDDSIDNIAAQIDTKLRTHYKAVLPASATLVSMTAREELVAGDTSIPAEAVIAINQAGTRATADTELPLGMTLLMTTRSGAAVRSGHGRIFAPPPRDSNQLISGATWNTGGAYYTACATLATDMAAKIQVTDLGIDVWHLTPVIYSKTRRNRGDANWYFGITTVQLQATPHWLRSRMTAP